MSDKVEWPEVVSTATIIGCTGLTRDAIAKHARAGHIRRIAYGKWPFQETIQRLLQHYETVAAARGGDSAIELTRQRARLARAQWKLQEAKNKNLEAKLLPVEDVREMVEVCAAHIRARVMELPAALAPKLAAVDSISQAQEIARDAIYGLLTDLANTEFVVGEEKAVN